MLKCLEALDVVIGPLAPLQTVKSSLYIDMLSISARNRQSCFNILLIQQLMFIEQLVCVSEVNGRPSVVHCEIEPQMLVSDRNCLMCLLNFFIRNFILNF